MKESIKIYSLAILLRVTVLLSPLPQWFQDRVEINTPLTDWKRVKEGIALQKMGVSPYTGDVVHETPLSIQLFCILGPYSQYFFIFIDILIAAMLKYSAGKIYALMMTREKKDECHPTFSPHVLNENDQIGLYSAMVYLFNPYTVVICVTQSTQLLNNLFYTLTLFGLANRSVLCAALGSAAASYLSLFPAMFMFPILYFMKADRLKGILGFVFFFTLLHAASFYLTSSALYLEAVYGFALKVPDYTPNIGAAWYFFAEMFPHFTVLFLCVYQVNLFLYAVPLTLRFPTQPALVVFSLLMILAMFKPYTSVGDYCIPLAMLPIWLHLFKYMNQVFVIAVAVVVLTLLWPIMWYLWMHCLNANSNFYFAITLAFVLFQSLLLSDVLFAQMRRDYDFKNGVKLPVIDGEEAIITLS